MSDHFQWYPSSGQNVTPWNAQYTFPEQSNKSIRVATRVPPKNGPTFVQGNTIRLEFPAQGHVNPAETTLVFDLKIEIPNYVQDASNSTDWWVYMQNNIASIFSRARLLYGSTPLEDIGNAGFLIRQLTEWTSTSSAVNDQTSIAQGIAGARPDYTDQLRGKTQHVRKFTHALARCTLPIAGGHVVPFTGTRAFPSGSISSSSLFATRRYQISFPFGLFQQGKLLPVKFMASQLAIELSLASNTEAMMVVRNNTGGVGGTFNLSGSPRYTVSNVSMIVESMEFDATYDAMFLQGLQSGGVPIQFATWNNYTFQQGRSLTNDLMIQERSRSVKSIFSMLRLQDIKYEEDSGATFGHIGTSNSCPLLSYQYRIGARYFPASPVICASSETPGHVNGGCEAYTELQKCLNTLGDARLSTGVNSYTWNAPLNATGVVPAYVSNADGLYELTAGSDFGIYTGQRVNGGCAGIFSSVFCMATCLETTNGLEISGLNAEEQSDISLILRFSGVLGTVVNFSIEVFTYTDAMVVLRENNVLELIK